MRRSGRSAASRRAARAVAVAVGGVLVVLLPAVPPAQAYLKLGISYGGSVLTLHWPSMPIRYYVNDQNLPGLSAAEYRAALDRASASWEAVGSSTVAFQAAGTTTALPTDADGVTAVGFVSRPDLDRVLGSTAFIVDTVSGEILEAGVFFNSTFSWSVATGGEAGKYDLESVALHEFGHLAGLGHSALGETDLTSNGRHVLAAEAVMFPVMYAAGSTAGRRLKADDIAGVSDIYPGPSFRAETGSITGHVTRGGSGVLGAHVVAFNVSTRALVGGFTMDGTGAFAVAGLEPGSYIVRAEPLDDADVSGFFGSGSGVDVSFGATYLDRLVIVSRGGSTGPFEIRVAAK
jgi:hypothetical protein